MITLSADYLNFKLGSGEKFLCVGKFTCNLIYTQLCLSCSKVLGTPIKHTHTQKFNVFIQQTF